MKTRKGIRTILCLLAALMLCLPAGRPASADIPGVRYLTEELADGTLMITGLSETGRQRVSLTVPASRSGKAVTALAIINLL